MIFKGLNSVISILLALSLLSGSLTIFYYEMGSSLEIIFGKIISEKLYNNAQLATVGVKSAATYTLPPYTRAGFHEVTAMDGNTGSIIYVYNYESYDSIRNKLQFVKSIIHNAELLSSAGVGELGNNGNGNLAKIEGLKAVLNQLQLISGFLNWIDAHISGNYETVKGGNAYYIPMKILLECTDGIFNGYAGNSEYTTREDGGGSYTIVMRRVRDDTTNEYIIYWNVTEL